MFQSLGGHASARRVSHEPCFRQAHCFVQGPLRFLPVLPNPTCARSHIWGLSNNAPSVHTVEVPHLKLTFYDGPERKPQPFGRSRRVLLTRSSQRTKSMAHPEKPSNKLQSFSNAAHNQRKTWAMIQGGGGKNRGQELNTNISSQTFGALSEYPGKNPGISCKKKGFTGFEGHTERLGPHPFTPQEDIGPKDLGLGSFFLPEKHMPGENAPDNAPSRKILGPLQKSFWCAQSWSSVPEKERATTPEGWKTYQTNVVQNPFLLFFPPPHGIL